MLLTAENDSIEIDPSRGGRVVAFSISGLDVIVEQAQEELDWGCYPMAPWAGRVRNGRFPWADIDVQLPLRMPPHAIHGTVFDRPWNEGPLGQLEIDLGEDWPFRGSARSRFRMDPGSFHWELTVSSEEEPMPVIAGWHPWFRKQLADGSRAALHFHADAMYVRDQAGIPSGARQPPTQGPWDDCFSGVSPAPRIEWSNGLWLEVSSSCDHWVVYNEPKHALCVEPQSAPPDGFNRERFSVVRPGQPLVHSMTWRWWRE